MCNVMICELKIPCISIIYLHDANPNQVPIFSVVNSGSKIFYIFSSGITESEMDIVTEVVDSEIPNFIEPFVPTE